jgi:hypothetical protein
VVFPGSVGRRSLCLRQSLLAVLLKMLADHLEDLFGSRLTSRHGVCHWSLTSQRERLAPATGLGAHQMVTSARATASGVRIAAATYVVRR